jgi:hypothetical protein
MKKFIVLIVVTILSSFLISCKEPPVQNGNFRVKTRYKLVVAGINTGISLPRSFTNINLKTTTAIGTVGTTGTTTEFNPGGGFVQTSLWGRYETQTPPVIPAPWTVKFAPGQGTCSTVAAQTFPATNGGIYRVFCNANVNVQFLIQPSQIDLSDQNQNNGGIHLTGITGKPINGEARFANTSNLKVRYYKFDPTDGDYEFDQEHPATSVSADGKEAIFPIPNRGNNQGLVDYKLLFVEDDALYDSFIGYGDLQVTFPTIGSGCYPVTNC